MITDVTNGTIQRKNNTPSFAQKVVLTHVVLNHVIMTFKMATQASKINWVCWITKMNQINLKQEY